MDWELNLWEDFKSTQDVFFLDESITNRLIRSPTTSGRFLCQSFRKNMNTHHIVVPILKALWCILVRFKIKTFMWLIFCQRLPLRDCLCRLPLINSEENLCPLWSNFMEGVSCLFLHCNRVSLLWYQVVGLWDMQIAGTSSIQIMFNLWTNADLSIHKI